MKIKVFVVAVLLTAFSALGAFAQVGRMEGEVKKAGSGEPIPNAEVQIHRNDIKWSATLKTDKKGKFIHAGIQYGGTYTIIVGADGFAPAYSNGHKPDQPIPAYELMVGDGKRLTIDEVRADMAKGRGGAAPGAAPGAGGNKAAATGPSKKEIEEYNKKVEEVKKKNESIEATNKAMNAALEAGKTAFNAKDYNTAIAEFDKGIALDAEQNVFWYFKGLALYNRGVTNLNASLQDPTKRDPAKADFTDAITNATKAIALLDAQSQAAGAADPTKAAQNKTNKAAYVKVRADSSSLLGRRFSDAAMAEAANKDYVAIAEMTDDPALKKKHLFTGAETLRDAGKVEEAVAAYKAIIELDPNYADAYYGIGLSYFGN